MICLLCISVYINESKKFSGLISGEDGGLYPGEMGASNRDPTIPQRLMSRLKCEESAKRDRRSQRSSIFKVFIEPMK